jgi:hypothetical protein
VVLPDPDFVARLCKQSSLDPVTMAPSPASFEFRFGFQEGAWKEDALSVDWLELLPDGSGSLPQKVDRLRTYLLGNHDFEVKVIKPTSNMRFAVLPVAKIHSAKIEETTLECRHDPRGEGDTHAGIYPTPGVDAWPAFKDHAAHLNMQLYLYESICHSEPGR